MRECEKGCQKVWALKNQKLMTLVIHGTEALLYTNISLSLYMGQIRHTVDNKKVT